MNVRAHVAQNKEVANMDRETVFRIAGAAECDPRTVERYAAGGSLKPLLRDRIEAAITKLGIKAPAQKATVQRAQEEE